MCVGVSYVSLLLLKVPLEIAIMTFGALATGVGTVATNVHWIVLPATLPFTEFTFSWGTKTRDR